MHSVALQVHDLDATMAHLEAKGVRIAARPRPEMCFTDPRDTAGVFVQWSCFELDVDPHFGAPVPVAGSAPRSRSSSTPSWGRWSRNRAGSPTAWPSSWGPR